MMRPVDFVFHSSEVNQGAKRADAMSNIFMDVKHTAQGLVVKLHSLISSTDEKAGGDRFKMSSDMLAGSMFFQFRKHMRRLDLVRGGRNVKSSTCC